MIDEKYGASKLKLRFELESVFHIQHNSTLGVFSIIFSQGSSAAVSAACT